MKCFFVCIFLVTTLGCNGRLKEVRKPSFSYVNCENFSCDHVVDSNALVLWGLRDIDCKILDKDSLLLSRSFNMSLINCLNVDYLLNDNLSLYLTKLQKLTLVDCGIVKLNSNCLSESPLKSLIVRDSIFDYDSFSLLKTHMIEELTLSCDLKQVPMVVYDNNHLKRLDISGNIQIKDVSPLIQNLTNLECLYLGGTSVCKLPKEIYKLKTLKVLDISYTPISNQILSDLKEMRESLLLSEIHRELPNCEVYFSYAAP